jgi:hypothetical protein
VFRRNQKKRGNVRFSLENIYSPGVGVLLLPSLIFPEQQLVWVVRGRQLRRALGVTTLKFPACFAFIVFWVFARVSKHFQVPQGNFDWILFPQNSGSENRENIPSQNGDTQKTDQFDRKVNSWAD